MASAFSVSSAIDSFAVASSARSGRTIRPTARSLSVNESVSSTCAFPPLSRSRSHNRRMASSRMKSAIIETTLQHPSIMSSSTTRFVRLFCVCSAAVVLPLAPLAVAGAGQQRRHPIALEGSRALSGGAVITGRGEVLEAIRFGDAPWTAAASPEARRRFRNVPAGTSIAYRLRDGRIAAGRVTSVPADAATILRRLDLAFLTLLFAVAGLALGLGGLNRAATSAGGFLSGLAVTLGFSFVEPNVVHLASPAARDALIIAFALVPGALWCRYLLLLAAELPFALRIGPAGRAVIAGVSIAAIARAVLLAFSQAGALFDRLPAGVATAIVRLLESNLLQLIPYLATAAAALWLVVRQSRALRERQGSGDVGERARIVAWGCGVGTGIPLLAALVQGVSLLVTRRLAMPREAMALLLLPLALVPVSLTYALLSRRVDRVGVLARRAVIFAVADRTLLAVALVAVAILGVLFYQHRGEPIGRFAAEHAAVVVLTVAAILLASPLRRRLQQLFFRSPHSLPLADSFPSAASKAPDAEALGRAVAEHVDHALHVESTALLAYDRARGVLADAAGVLAPLDLSSPLARTAAERGSSFALDPSRFAEAERAWIAQRGFAVATPLLDSGGRLLGLLAVGEKMSGLSFEREDLLLLDATAASAALALENLQLRDRQAVAATPPPPGRALICDTCGAVCDPLISVRCAADTTPLTAADVPHVLHGKFRFERRLGRGAMGVVYRARDLVLGREVAIKTLPTLAAETAERFEREARAVAALSHPGIAVIHAWESWHGRPMLVFELLEGGTLAERIAGGPLPPAEVVRVGMAMAGALAHAHAAGILHRDIKPENLAFGRDDAVKVLDFGLAQFRDEVSTGLAGTPLYFSPEAVVGGVPAPAFDVWAAAVTLYEALTGSNPFEAPSVLLAMNAVLSREIPDPRTLRAGVPGGLAEVLLRALHRDPVRRIATAAALRQALAGLSRESRAGVSIRPAVP
jgi:tRNA A-37 threonylcarbamoyl transferase component Bud32/GAF domain-containing protein